MSDGNAVAHPLLDSIAALLGTTPEAFRDPAYLDGLRRRRIEVLADLLAADPQFARIAQTYLDLPDPAGRRAIADSVVAIAGAFAMQCAMQGDG